MIIFSRRSSVARTVPGLPRLVAPWLCASAILLPPLLPAQAAHAPPPAGRLTMDPAIRAGTLPNGLRYYVQPNAVPAHRAELRLVVGAGSVLEDPAQRGLAHFVEHMAFNGTTHFKKLDIVRYLESMGMRFGADLNAETTFDETVYRFTLPTDRPDALPTGLEILADWAHGISFDSAAVEAERGIILGEWRSRTNAGGARWRVSERYMDDLLRDSPYVDRMPIGLPAAIETAPRPQIVRFYRDWYRPERMAVIVVGDVDAAAVEALIRRELGAIPRADHARPRPSLTVPVPTTPRYEVVADSEITDGSVSLAYRLPALAHGTAAGFRRGLVDRLAAYMLSERLSDLDRGTIGLEEPVRDVRTYTLRAPARDGDVRAALAGLLGLVAQVAQHGFTPDEFQRVVAYTLAEYENGYERRAATPSAVLADALTTSFLTGTVVVESEQFLVMARHALSGDSAITLEEVNAAARATLGQPGRLIFVVGATRTRTGLPTVQAIARIADSVARASAPTYAAELARLPLVPVLPAPGRVDSMRALTKIGAQEWVLSNGARVILKPTDFNPNQVLVSAVAPGGTSVAADSDYIEAQLATSALATSGIGTLTVPMLQRRLRSTGSSVALTPFIGELNQGVNGEASPRDLATLFQLIYLAFTAPRADTAAIAAWRDKLREQLATAGAEQAIRAILTGHAPRARPITPAMLDSLDVRRALAFYRARFADASAFTFYLVGAFDPDSIKPLVERYIGGLPATHAHETWRDLGVRPIAGPHTINAPVSPDAKTSMQLVITGPMSYDASENMVLNALGEIAQRRLLERLRTELHATYGVQLSTSAARWPWPHYEMDIRFDAAPEQADSLAAAALAVLDTLRARGPTANEVVDIKALEARRLELGRRDNEYWLAMLTNDVWNAWNYATGVTTADPLLDALTPERLRGAAGRYLDTAHVVRIAIRPRTTTS